MSTSHYTTVVPATVRKNHLGKRFGRLVVEGYAGNRNAVTYWACVCDCGNRRVVRSGDLASGNTRSCGCSASSTKLIDLTGARSGCLTVVQWVYTQDRRYYWLCLCECGNEAVVLGDAIRRGTTKSCGCLRHRRGEEHPNWKPGALKRWRPAGGHVAWRRRVFERDDYTCVVCKTRGGTLSAHHLNSFSAFPEQRESLDNGVTLCLAHHRAFHDEFMGGTRRPCTAVDFRRYMEAP